MNLLPTLPEFGKVVSIAAPAKLIRGVGQSFADMLHSATQSAAATSPVAVPQSQTAPAYGSSDTASRLAAQQQLAASLATVPGKSVALGNLRSQAEQALGHWQQAFAQRLSNAGVDLNQGFSLSVRPGDGKIVVAGDHPDKAKIESLLASDDDLSRSIRSINSTLELVQAADQHHEFAQAYEDDPVAAVTNFRQLFDSSTTVGVNYWIDKYGARASV